MKAVLIGAGRMGLTHIAQLNLLTDFNIRWSIVEPSAVVRAGLSYFLPKSMVTEVVGTSGEIDGNFDLAVVTSPTMHHDAAWQMFRGRAERFLIEKPLKVREPQENVLCGYVLLHHPLQVRLRAIAQARTLRSAHIRLRANTVLSANHGWRGRRETGGGVINEFGSHVLSLLVDLVGPVESLEIAARQTVHSVDVPDIARLHGRSASGKPFMLDLDWTDESVRKPGYSVEVSFDDGATAGHDLYELSDGDRNLSIAEIDTASGVYLRGLEFTAQARCFLEEPSFGRYLAIAVEVDRLLEMLG